MKKLVLFSALLAVMVDGAFAAEAQPNPAAAAAERQEAEERQRILNATVADLAAAQAAQQKRITRLAEEIKSLRDAAAAPPAVKYATAEDLKSLAERLAELDKRREADKELILAEIAKLAKTLSAPPPVKKGAPKPTPAPPPAPPKTEGDLPVLEYTVQKGDNSLTAIVLAYNDAAKKEGRKTITVQQVMDANPGLNPNRMKIGQKINLPVPK